MMSWYALYNEGRIRSFIAASIIAKFFVEPFFTYSTLVNSTPAFPKIARPGSKIIFKSRPVRIFFTVLVYSEKVGGSSLEY